jgi:2-C-methyl-D-erythritol 2,4-cyclodiphosphate synthase
MFRVGSGVDVHAFAQGVPLWLGGVQIPHPRGLAGHSDGDAATHALIDALLGATGQGDIGAWFPSADPRWEGARSTDLLAEVWTRLASDGWRIENVDLTIVASEPRLSSHRHPMREALAAALSCPVASISVKATTTDGLGPLGQGEGILALAVVLMSKG